MSASPQRLSTRFDGSIKNLAFLLFLPLVLLCCASTAQAVPVVITGGSIGTATGIGNFSMSVTGMDFSFSGHHGGAPKTQLCGLCQPGTRFGGGGIAVQLTVAQSLIYNGMSYSPATGYVPSSGGNILTVQSIIIPADLSPVIVPFSFVGNASAFSLNGSPSLHFELTGTGIATFTFNRFGQNVLSQASFVFTPPASVPDPIPEPATLLLLGTGLAGAGAARLRRRRREG